MLRTNIKNWYSENFADDELGEVMNENVTFEGLFETLKSNNDVYGYLGVSDSIIRERVFEKLSEVLNCDYDYIYKLWMN